MSPNRHMRLPEAITWECTPEIEHTVCAHVQSLVSGHDYQGRGLIILSGCLPAGDVLEQYQMLVWNNAGPISEEECFVWGQRFKHLRREANDTDDEDLIFRVGKHYFVAAEVEDGESLSGRIPKAELLMWLPELYGDGLVRDLQRDLGLLFSTAFTTSSKVKKTAA